MKVLIFIIFLILFNVNGNNVTKGVWPQIVHLIGQGLAEGSQKDGLNIFLGIPYATPPIENLRWKPPQKPEPFDGIFQALKYGPACIQTFPDDYTFPVDQKFSEDCLSLNIYAPDTPGSKSVLFWIHGGAFVHGGSSEFRIRGEYFAKSQNIVVVTINYRLGTLGFFANSVLKNENPNFQTTGNYGFLDQIFALEWVKENIFVFGGDPENITIAGESAGASSTCYHLIYGQNSPLFSKAILESSACFGEMQNLTQSYQNSKKVIENLNCQNRDQETEIECMRQKNALNVWKAYAVAGAKTTVDGVVFKESSYNSFVKSHYAKVPVIAGNVGNEGTAFIYPQFPKPVSQIGYRDYIQQTTEKAGYPQYTNSILSEYPCSSSDCRPQMSRYFGDSILRCPTLLIANYMSKTVEQPIFSYTFTHAPSWSPPIIGAYHSSDVPFVFSTIKYYNNTTPSELKLAHEMSSYWGNFVKFGNPNNLNNLNNLKGLNNLYEWQNFSQDNHFWKLNLNLTVNEMPENYGQDICVKFWNPIFDLLYSSY